MKKAEFQVHHIIPLEIFTTFAPELKEIFGVSDISEVIQSYNNRISLFTDKASAGAMQAL